MGALLPTPAPSPKAERAQAQNVVSFGRELFATKDLDPVYVALLSIEDGKHGGHPQHFGRPQMARWLVAYWCFYDAGFASYASEFKGDTYWTVMRAAALNLARPPFGTKLARWPRGSERRHMRGKFAEKVVAGLQQAYKHPEDMLAALTRGKRDIASVIARAKAHYGFGDWMAFKVADMLDAVWEYEVDQGDVSFFLYDTPRRAIHEVWELGQMPDVPTQGFDTTRRPAYYPAMVWLLNNLKWSKIPHKPGYSPDWFSLETVWCKYGSYLSGHYPIGKDIREVGHAALVWAPVSPTAGRFFKAMPLLHPVI